MSSWIPDSSSAHSGCIPEPDLRLESVSDNQTEQGKSRSRGNPLMAVVNTVVVVKMVSHDLIL